MAINKKKEEILFGIELEFSNPLDDQGNDDLNDVFQEDVENALNKARSNIIVEGSINCDGRDGGGTEIAIGPKPFDWYKDNSEYWLAPILEQVKEHHFSGATQHAGIHVHTDRSVFSKHSFIRFVDFLRENRAFLLDYSNRTKKRKHFCDVETTQGKLNYSFKKINESTYVGYFEDRNFFVGNHCLILSNNGKGTVECRFFNGSNDPVYILATLEFTRALIYFCKSTHRKDKSLLEFLSYVVDYAVRYPNLMEVLIKKEWISPRVHKPKLKEVTF